MHAHQARCRSSSLRTQARPGLPQRPWHGVALALLLVAAGCDGDGGGGSAGVEPTDLGVAADAAIRRDGSPRPDATGPGHDAGAGRDSASPGDLDPAPVDTTAAPDAGDTSDLTSAPDSSPDPTDLDPAIPDTGPGPVDAGPALPDAGPVPDTGGVPAAQGRLLALTYNVAGLPEGISRSHPERNIPMISPLLNSYDLVLAQEDFWYPLQLRADTEHAFRTETEPALGDGLNRFSNHPFVGFVREPWSVCFGQLDHGSDCLAAKGFSFARHHLARGVELDVYNFHMEAGGAQQDVAARVTQAEQLLAFMHVRSEGRSVLLMGDTNLHGDDPEDVPVLQRLLDGAGLSDVCATLECGDDRIDRILVRSSPSLELAPLRWWLPGEFVDPEGAPLSDHAPVAAELQWRQR